MKKVGVRVSGCDMCLEVELRWVQNKDCSHNMDTA